MPKALYFSIIFISLLTGNVSGQLRQRTEVGAGIGMFNYTGDLVRNYNLRFSTPAATIYYRYNFNHVISLRTGFTFGRVAANDKTNPLDIAANERGASFSIPLMELAPTFEYHFLDWKDAKGRVKYTPYLFAGAGIFIFSGNENKPVAYSNAQINIPFGGGFKYIVNPHWYAGFEFGIRKTFFDYLDNVSARIRPSKRPLNFGNSYDKDNYFFVGFTLTRTFYEIPCASSPY